MIHYIEVALVVNSLALLFAGMGGWFVGHAIDGHFELT